MTVKQSLYLRRAAGARREPKHYCGECASLGENSISGGYGITDSRNHQLICDGVIR
ncbi:hypothetical protein CLOM621_06531 [Clostridium sp. M62/1]|nr:hypothetical protein CLOM621_06531 [Clostridium sp. M62/1]